MPSPSGAFVMRSPVVRWSFVTLMVLALAACGDGGGIVDPPDPPDPPAPPAIDSATTLAFAATTSNQMQGILHTVYGGQDLATPNPFILPSLGAPAGPSLVPGVSPSDRPLPIAVPCAPVITGVDSLGVAFDSDADGIPDDLTVDYGAGCTLPSGGVEYTFSGKYRLQDPGGGLLDWSYTTTALSAMVRDTLTGDFFRQKVTGGESAHFTAGHAAHQMDVTLEVTSRNGGDTAHVALRTQEASIYDPTAGSTFQLGGTLPQGTLGFAGTLTFLDIAAGGPTSHFVISTPTPIHTSFACDTGIDAGELRGFFEGDDRVGFRYLWSGCVTPELQLFGTTP